MKGIQGRKFELASSIWDLKPEMLCLRVAPFSDEVVDCVVLIQMPVLFCALVCMRRQENRAFFFHLSAELGRKNRG